MAQKPLHESDVYAGLDQQCGGGMPEHMRRDPAIEAGFLGKLSELRTYRLRPHVRAMAIHEQRTGAGLCAPSMLNDAMQIHPQRRIGNIPHAIARTFAV